MADNLDIHPLEGTPDVDVAVIGAGQAGLATGFYLRRAGLAPGRDFVMLDAAERPGGAWPRTWDGLRLFSPAGFSSLPGWMMPPWDDASRGFPTRDHVVDYLTRPPCGLRDRHLGPSVLADVSRDAGVRWAAVAHHRLPGAE